MQRRAAIAEHHAVRLTASGLELPHQPARVAQDNASASEPKKPQPAPIAARSEPKPDAPPPADALPPVPGPVAKKPKTARPSGV